MKYGFVYCWTNIINDKKYIGSHYGNINDSYIGSGVYFKRAYLKNPNNFKRDILYIGKNYQDIEKYFLVENNAQYNDSFYNLKNESIGGWKHVNIEKRGIAISKAKKGKYPEHLRYDKFGINNPMFDKKHSIETKNKISKSRIGKSNSDKKVIELSENKIFDSVTKCALHYGITQPTMTALIRNEKINRGKCKNKIFSYV
jgi:hypothetical protein